VIIIKIGQSAANLFNSFDIVFLKSQEFSEETSSSSLTSQSNHLDTLDLEEQATNEEQEEESDDLSDLVETDLSIEEGSSETTRENELFLAHAELPIHRPHHTYPKNDEELGYYLAGLIDGDGYISNEDNQPTITITFHKKDTFLAYKIKSLLGYGLVRCYSSYSIYTITNREGLIKMLYLIYNKLRLIHKVNRLNKLIEKYNLPLEKSIPDNSNVTLTHYLAGLLDSDGSLTIKLLKRKRGLLKKETTEVRLLARVEMNSLLGSNVINKLKADIGGSLSIRNFSYAETKVLGAKGVAPTTAELRTVSYAGARMSRSIVWNSVSFKRMYWLLLYLDRYNLCSKKYLEYLYIRKAYLLIQQKKHLTSEGLIKISYFQKRVSELKHLE